MLQRESAPCLIGGIHPLGYLPKAEIVGSGRIETVHLVGLSLSDNRQLWERIQVTNCLADIRMLQGERREKN